MTTTKHFKKFNLFVLFLPILTVTFLVIISGKLLDHKLKKEYEKATLVENSLVEPTIQISNTMAKEELKKHDGRNPELPIYMAYDGIVYDVSSGSKFYAKGRPYNFLTGKDATKEINLVGLGSTIKDKYTPVARLEN